MSMLPRLALAAVAVALVVQFGAVPLPVAGASVSAERKPDVEGLALRLLNCTRTGGWVLADGSCRGYGSGRYSARRHALELHHPLSRKVAWPWARKLAIKGACGHELRGSPAWYLRFSRAGFRTRPIAENVGCASSISAMQAVIMTHRLMQAEKSNHGSHWRNMKLRGLRSVGIAVARSGARIRVVYEFYGGKAP